jgi:hypothetical protein
VAVRPPGLAIGPLRPPLTLQEAERGAATPVPPQLATVVELRNLQGRWEFLIEAFHEAEAPAPESAATVGAAPSGVDRVTITLRPTDGREIELTVDDGGRLSVGSAEAAAVLPGVMARHRRFEDRWRARVILPVDWMEQLSPTPMGKQDGRAATTADLDAVAHLSVERRLVDGRRLNGPLVTAPWRGLVGTTITVDLGAWDALEIAP